MSEPPEFFNWDRAPEAESQEPRTLECQTRRPRALLSCYTCFQIVLNVTASPQTKRPIRDACSTSQLDRAPGTRTNLEPQATNKKYDTCPPLKSTSLKYCHTEAPQHTLDTKNGAVGPPAWCRPAIKFDGRSPNMGLGFVRGTCQFV